MSAGATKNLILGCCPNTPCTGCTIDKGMDIIPGKDNINRPCFSLTVAPQANQVVR